MRRLHDEEIRSRLIAVTLHAAGDPDALLQGELWEGEFAFLGVRPGLYDVRLGGPGSDERIALVANVWVTAEERTEDPRVDPVDVRGLVTQVELDVRLPDGSAADEVRTWTRTTGSDEPWIERRRISARSMTTAAPAIDAVLFSPGYRLVELEAVAGERRVVLEPGIPLRARVETGLPDHGHEVAFEAELRAPGPAGSELIVRALVDGEGAAAMRAPRTGSMTIGLRARSLLQSREVDGARVDSTWAAPR